MEHQKLKQNVAHVSAAANDRDSTTNPISNGNSSGGFYFAIVLCILGHSFKMFLTDKGSWRTARGASLQRTAEDKHGLCLHEEICLLISIKGRLVALTQMTDIKSTPHISQPSFSTANKILYVNQRSPAKPTQGTMTVLACFAQASRRKLIALAYWLEPALSSLAFETIAAIRFDLSAFGATNIGTGSSTPSVLTVFAKTASAIGSCLFFALPVTPSQQRNAGFSAVARTSLFKA